jgi:hypothetical protein
VVKVQALSPLVAEVALVVILRSFKEKKQAAI